VAVPSCPLVPDLLQGRQHRVGHRRAVRGLHVQIPFELSPGVAKQQERAALVMCTFGLPIGDP